MNTKIIKFDINKNLYDTLIAKQGDTKSRFLLFNLLDGSIPFSLENRSVRVYAIKPDGTEIFNDLIITDAAKGYCILELTTQMLAVAGTVKLELMVIEDEKKLTSNIFYMDVKKSINSEKAVVSTNEFGALLTALSSLNEYDNYKKEIAAARDGEANLLTKVKKIDEQLDTNVQQLNNKINEVATTGTTTEAVQNKVEEMAEQGLIQAYTLGDRTVTERKTVFFDVAKSANIFNKNDCVDGYYIDMNTGNKTANSSFCYVESIEVESNTQYTSLQTNGGQQIVFRDSNKTYISGYSQGTGASLTFTTPTNCKYIDVSIPISKKDVFTIVKGVEANADTSYWTKYKLKNEYITPTIGNLIVVDKNGYGDYTSVTQAVQNAVDGDTILILPGTYDDEIVNSPSKKINFIAFSKEATIIKNGYNDYNKQPVNVAKGSFYNLTIISDNDKDTGTGNGSYGVHIDDNNSCNNTLAFHNCKVISKNKSAVGIGLRPNFDLIFDNCELISEASSGIFVHTSANTSYLGGNQFLTINNCDVISTAIDTPLQIQECYGEENWGAIISKNSMYWGKSGKPTEIKYLSHVGEAGGTLSISNKSFGNNVNFINV